MKLGSLFDGSGGFPLAGSLCGIEPVWASEVEPYPIAVTRSRFPNMKHLGDISKINGAEIEPVDVITFGSPCQDLSVAGKRAGLKHEANGDEETTRSGLFMEAVRIIKEMRKATNGKYPTFALWENVPGAFSSNGGEDFRIVLEELIKIVEPTAVMPPVPKAGWAYADSFVGDGWSLAYRVFDAQYWGVPQRRRRIHLVADFRGERAGQILFEREGLRGDFTQSGETRKETAGDVGNGAQAADREGKCCGLDGYNATLTGEVSSTLGVNCGMSTGRNGVCVPYNDQYLFQPMPLANVAATLRAGAGAPKHESDYVGRLVVQPVPNINGPHLFQPIAVATQQGGAEITQDGICPTITAAAGMSGNNQPWICSPVTYDARGNGDGIVVSTLTGDHNNRITDYTSGVCEPIPIHDKATRYKGGGVTRNGDGAGNGLGVGEEGSPMYTVTTGDKHAVAFLASGKERVGTLMANASTKMWLGNQEAFSGDYHIIEETPTRYIVRRLTPTECARLQGFPDRWGDIDEKTDFADEEYKFWLEVRNTHAEINGKAVKEYTKEQMLKWYSKLHTDSAEYKMWGNGIALPPALYCMQGIAEALSEGDF